MSRRGGEEESRRGGEDEMRGREVERMEEGGGEEEAGGKERRREGEEVLMWRGKSREWIRGKVERARGPEE